MSCTADAPATRRGLGMALGFGLGAIPVFLGAINHDVAWYLYAADRMLAGDRLYVDVIDTNPPLILWLTMATRWLAGWLGVSEIATLRVLMLGLIGGSLVLTHRVLLASLPGRRSWLLLAMFVMLWLPGYDFAQREHLLVVLVLPYLAAASGRAIGRDPGAGLAWAVGLAAGVGLVLKPHFVLPWLAVEATLAKFRGRRSWVRPEALAVMSFGLIYAVVVLVGTPEYLRLMAWVGPVYAASGGAPWFAWLAEPATTVTALAVFGVATIRTTEGDDGRRALGPILAADLGLLAAAIVQGKGFGYHYYPALALGVLLVGLIAVVARARRPGLMGATLAVLVVVSVVARLGDSLAWRGSPGRSDTPLGRMIRAVDEQAEGGPIYVFSPAVGAGFPLVNYGRVGWSSRQHSLWFLSAFHPRGFAAASLPAKMGAAERRLVDGVVEDLLAGRPTLMFVDVAERPRAFAGQPFHYLDYFAQDPRFAAFLRDYEPSGKLDDFRIYLRKRSGSADVSSNRSRASAGSATSFSLSPSNRSR